MNRRKMAINVIVAEVAETGEAGRCAIRAYVETRLSKQAFNQACEIGLKIFKRSKCPDSCCYGTSRENCTLGKETASECNSPS